jgi:hypothetical protein
MDRPEEAIEPRPSLYQFHRIDLRFVNGNPNVEMITEGKSHDHFNYYGEGLGADGVTYVHHFSSVTYRNVWPYIDVRCNATDDGFKYDVLVQPGGAGRPLSCARR